MFCVTTPPGFGNIKPSQTSLQMMHIDILWIAVKKNMCIIYLVERKSSKIMGILKIEASGLYLPCLVSFGGLDDSEALSIEIKNTLRNSKPVLHLSCIFGENPFGMVMTGLASLEIYDAEIIWFQNTARSCQWKQVWREGCCHAQNYARGSDRATEFRVYRGEVCMTGGPRYTLVLAPVSWFNLQLNSVLSLPGVGGHGFQENISKRIKANRDKERPDSCTNTNTYTHTRTDIHTGINTNTYTN